MADKTSDCGHNEQMSVVLRFHDQTKNSTVEHMTALSKLDRIDAETISLNLEKILVKFGIQWENVLCACFDGAAAMSGHLSGVQQKCKEKNPNICYVHCYDHCLNLSLVDSCDRKVSKIVSNFFGII